MYKTTIMKLLIFFERYTLSIFVRCNAANMGFAWI